ncbi:MAG: ISL3 family transposase [Actinomycetota bacterium]
MPEQAINATLDLEGLVVIGVGAFGDLIELMVESQFDAGCCRSCGGLAPEPKGRPEVLVRDLAISGRAVVLRWRKRRWRCTYCTSSWTESHPEIPSRARMTLRFKEYLADQAVAQGNFSRVAAQEGVSYDTVARAHKARADLVRLMRPRPAPKIISIDEAAVRKGHSYNTIISDVMARYVVDTIEGRHAKPLVRWFSELDDDVREGIEVVVMDMSPSYRAIIAGMLPHAVRVADKFHVIRMANLAVDRVRARSQGRGTKKKTGWPHRLFHCRFALLRSAENARPGDAERLDVVFRVFPEVHKAWRLKEGLRQVYAETDPVAAALALEVWLQLVRQASLPEFDQLAATVCRWKPEILNYFTYRMTNAYAEGITNRIKVIKRQGYGFRNFNNFQDRILVQCGVPKLRIPS